DASRPRSFLSEALPVTNRREPRLLLRSPVIVLMKRDNPFQALNEMRNYVHGYRRASSPLWNGSDCASCMREDCMQNGFSRLVQVDSCFRGLLQRRTLYYLWAESPRMDLVGKSVVLIHPAWHSCGSHSVFCSQVDAYRALGAHVLSLAV